MRGVAAALTFFVILKAKPSKDEPILAATAVLPYL